MNKRRAPGRTTSGKLGADPGPRKLFTKNDDQQIVLALEERARALAGHLDETDRRTREVIARFASDEAARLRSWMVAFRDSQATAAAREAPMGRELADQLFPVEEGGPLEMEPADLRRRVAQIMDLQLDDPIRRDEEGRPLAIDVPTLLDSLAYWVCSHRSPKPWQRSKLFDEVAARSRELANLLEMDGPEWTVPIDLFESAARPKYVDGDFAVFRRAVRDPLHRQSWPVLLRNLASDAERLKRLSQMDSAVRHTPRPTAPGAWERRLAREIRDWFDMRCGRSAPADVIADVINLARTPAVRSAKEDVTGTEVSDWLRAPRSSPMKPRKK